MNIPDISPHKQTSLTADQIQFFHSYGFLVFRNALSSEELQNLRNETWNMIDEANVKQFKNNPDYWYNNEIPHNWYKTHASGKEVSEVQPDTESIPSTEEVKRGVPFRIEYPVDKSKACQVLMGHPFVLMAMEQLLGTRDFIPTWDSLVFKMEGDGVPIKWHRDASEESVGSITPAIDVGFYLDSATKDMDNCLWVIPGSHKWMDMMASHLIEHLSSDGFKRVGAIPVPVEPGDIILHNILIIHGSPACKSSLRRTVYFEYRSIPHELKHGPHKPSYMPLKQSLLENCIQERKQFPDLDSQIGNQPYVYEPSDKS